MNMPWSTNIYVDCAAVTLDAFENRENIDIIDEFSPLYQNQTGVSDGQGYLEER